VLDQLYGTEILHCSGKSFFMKTVLLFFTLLFGTFAYSQSTSPFDTLQVSKAEMTRNFIELNASQDEQIDVLNERTKGYVIAVFAEEAPGSKLFEARMQDIRRHRDYKLQRILTVDQFMAYNSKTVYISKTVVSENR
jgi:hypothetical protein